MQLLKQQHQQQQQRNALQQQQEFTEPQHLQQWKHCNTFAQEEHR